VNSSSSSALAVQSIDGHPVSGAMRGDSDTLRLMFSGLRASFHQDREDWDTWQQKALVKYKNDDSLKVLFT